MLGALLARLSAAVPPGVLIPGQPGVPAPLNVYTCLVGPSGHGKTTVMDAANRAVALPTHMAPHPAQPVSGEGLIAAFLEWQQTEHTDPDTGRTVRSAQNVLTRPNVYATYDEHEGLDRVRSRKENTLDSYARTAWSGRDLATTTADARRTRHVPAGRYSLGITTGATIDVAAALAADTDRGTAQRWLMLPAAANADTYPTSRPDTVPAPFNVAPIEAQPGERVIHVAAAVRDELWREHVRPKTADDRAHQNQMRLRLAALASWLTNTLDDRGLPHVTTEHWQWAGTLIDTHRQTLDALTAHQTRLTAAAAAAANAAAAHRAVTVDAAVTTRRADTLEDMIALDAARAARWLTAPAQIGTPQRINTAPLDSRRIRRANTAHGINTADYLAAAIEHALDTGWITTAADNRYSPGATPPPA